MTLIRWLPFIAVLVVVNLRSSTSRSCPVADSVTFVVDAGSVRVVVAI